MTEEDVSYEIIPVTPIRKLEERMEKIESSGSTPQLQNLINQIIELIRNNQKIVNDVIQANNDLRNELSKLPSKMDELIDTINGFLELVEAAGKEEVNVTPQPVQSNAEAFKPIIDELRKISDQNQKLVESNQVVLNELNKMDRKLKGGMPVSTLLSNYPLKKEVRKVEQL
jgi:methyl-accepting chemotaxis protein